MTPASFRSRLQRIATPSSPVDVSSSSRPPVGTSGRASMLMPFEPEDHYEDVESVIDEDTGEVMLYRMEMKDG